MAAPTEAPPAALCAPQKSPTGGMLWWTREEAAIFATTQLSPSGCGPTAAVDVLKLLGLNPDAKEVQATAPARLRDYKAPLLQYLVSRARAGTTHLDLIQAVQQLSHGQAHGAFFSVHHLTPGALLGQWLHRWIAAGAVPVLTMNLFLHGNDAWHHQVVYGVEPPSHTDGKQSSEPAPSEDKGRSGWKVLLLNPLHEEPAERLVHVLSTPPVMFIPRDHVERRVFESLMQSEAPGSPLLSSSSSDAGVEAPQPAAPSPLKAPGIQEAPRPPSSSSAAPGEAGAAANGSEHTPADQKQTHVAEQCSPVDAPPLQPGRAAVTPVPVPSYPVEESSSLPQLCRWLQSTPPWSDLNVGEQVMNILFRCLNKSSDDEPGNSALADAELAPSDPSRGRHSRFGELVIPWGGLAGVTLFALEGSKAHSWLQTKGACMPLGTAAAADSTQPAGAAAVGVGSAPSAPVLGMPSVLDVPLPLYPGVTARVHLDLSPPLP